MATCRQTITTALRKLGIVGRGRATPSADEAVNGLAVLQAGYNHLFSEGKFGGWKEVIATGDYTAKEGDRIIKGAYTITMPTTVLDCFSGETRPPLDLSAVMVIASGSAPELHLYDAFNQAWGRCDGLTLDTVAPLSLRNADGLAAWLALAYASEFGAVGPAMPAVQAAAGGFVSMITRRPATPRPVHHTYF